MQLKYSHSESPKQLAIAHPTSIQSDDDDDDDEPMIAWHVQVYDSDIVEWQEGDDDIEW